MVIGNNMNKLITDIKSLELETLNNLRNSKKILTIDERKRISISENNDAKYIIDNYRHWHGISKKQFHISEDFKIYKEIFVGKQKIISIYKRI